jgi:hypothetical protein
MADAHQRADEYKSGSYKWREGGACAIGCTMRGAMQIGLLPKSAEIGDHAHLAEASGVPELAWRLYDHVFDGLPEVDRPAWTPRFLRAIRADADYSSLPARVMVRCARKLAEDAIDPEVKECCVVNADLWDRRSRGQEPTAAEWAAAWRLACAAGQEAEAVGYQACAVAHEADAAWHQAYAARNLTDAARQQTDAVRHQADAAWYQAYAVGQMAEAARQMFWKWCADMLCEELGQPEPSPQSLTTGGVA